MSAKAWPADGLEAVHACPVCGTSSRSLLHERLVDNVFFVAPGTWAAWRCDSCGSAYLDPRPTAATIGLAYEQYYTHAAQPVFDAPRASTLARLQRALANGYRNSRYGTRLQPSTRWGAAVVRLAPTIRERIDREFRRLPKVRGGGRVLDVGFGNASFLRCAELMGWRALGIDTDPAVVANARASGLDVRHVMLDDLDERDESFDVITLSHVIEHVHDPRAMLARCHRLLKPGGTLWIETPNIDSLGHRRFGADWRGMETPRHLAIFNGTSLRQLLTQIGFEQVRDLGQPSPAGPMFAMSDRSQRGLDPYGDAPVPARLRVQALLARVVERWVPARREFLAMQARRRG